MVARLQLPRSLSATPTIARCVPVKAFQRLGIEAHDFGQPRIRATQRGQSGNVDAGRHGEYLALAADQLVVVPARERLMLVNAHDQRIGPALARLHRFHPRQRGNRLLHGAQIEREEAATQARQHRGTDLQRVDMLEFGLHDESRHRPAPGGEPAAQNADDRQRDQREREAPGKQAHDPLHASSRKLVSSTRQHNVA